MCIRDSRKVPSGRRAEGQVGRQPQVRELARPVQEIVRQRADPFPDRPVAALRLPFPAVFPKPPQEIVARRKRKILREMHRLPFPLAAERPVLPPPEPVAFPEFQQFYSMTTAV